MSLRQLFGILLLFLSGTAHAQTTPARVTEVIKRQIQRHETIAYQLQEYLFKSIPKLPTPSSAQAWTEEEARLRKQILDDVAFHGWPKAWVDAAAKI